MEGLFSRAAVIGRTFLMVGAVGCGYLAERDLRYPWIAAAAIVVSLIATLYPAKAATAIAPVEALRYE